jgi:hypothetical protein
MLETRSTGARRRQSLVQPVGGPEGECTSLPLPRGAAARRRGVGVSGAQRVALTEHVRKVQSALQKRAPTPSNPGGRVVSCPHAQHRVVCAWARRRAWCSPCQSPRGAQLLKNWRRRRRRGALRRSRYARLRTPCACARSVFAWRWAGYAACLARGSCRGGASRGHRRPRDGSEDALTGRQRLHASECVTPAAAQRARMRCCRRGARTRCRAPAGATRFVAAGGWFLAPLRAAHWPAARRGSSCRRLLAPRRRAQARSRV